MRRLVVLFLLLLAGCTAVNKANKFYKEGDYDTAIKECRMIIEKDSLNADAHLLLGRCYHARGNFKDAIASLTTAYQITPASMATNKAKKELILVQFQYADSLFKKKNYNPALSGYKFVLELDPAHVNCLMKISDLYYENGMLTKARGHYQQVLKYDDGNQIAINKIEQIDRRSAMAEGDYQKGRKFFEKYQYNSAMKYLKKALENEPDHNDAQYYFAMTKGSILYNKGRKSDLWEAIEEFGKAMVLNPESGEPHYYLALAYEKKDSKDKRELDNAIEEYKNYLDKEPTGRFAKQCRKKIKDLAAARDKLKKFWGK
jgi:tetratricopeptide (TPR) repeat protein